MGRARKNLQVQYEKNVGELRSKFEQRRARRIEMKMRKRYRESRILEVSDVQQRMPSPQVIVDTPRGRPILNSK